MGSPLRLTVAPGSLPDDDAGLVADAAWTIIRGAFEIAESAMSRFREESELTALNRGAPGWRSISRPLERALSAADRARRITGGTFDPRIIDALERIGYSGVAQRPADGVGGGRADGHTEAQHPRVPGRILERDGRTGRVALACPVDLGGIGKGLALRWAANALDTSVVGTTVPPVSFLIDAGGDIIASGSPGADEPWRIAIEDPGGGARPLAVAAIAGRGAIATSSVRRLRWERDGRTVHHLIDPRTGEPGGEGLLAVSVAGPDPAWAEVWSKSLFLDGAGRIAGLARTRGLAAWWVTSDGALEMTAAARLRTVWVATEA